MAKQNNAEKRSRINAVDAFMVAVLLLLLLGSVGRVLVGRLNGLDYEKKATATFEIGESEKSVLSCMKEGDSLLLAEDGRPFGMIEEIRLLAEVGNTCKARGRLSLIGADTDAGFLTKEGLYLLPSESYRITDGNYTVLLTLTDLTVS